MFSVLLAVGVICAGPVFGDEPTGTVNPVCWKLLGIAGAGYVVLGGVIVVLAKKLWELVLARHEDQVKIAAAIREREEG